MSTDTRVIRHFDADAKRFDAIYDEKKGPLERFIDHVWRGVVRRRLDFCLERLAPLAGKSVLDVGCGSGRFCIAFALHGAKKVVGVDFAPAMIDIARDLTARGGVSDRVEYRVGAFPEAVPDGPFDASAAIGFFDYIAEPVPILAAMREKTRGTMIMSFPKSFEWRVPLRRLRFKMLGCPLHLYSAGRVRALMAAAGIERYELINFDRDWLVVAQS